MKYNTFATFAALNAPTLVNAASGIFSVLTMNVAGLPAGLQNNGVSGDGNANAEAIGSYFAQYSYDVINIQEDYAFHDSIYKTDGHLYRTPTSSNADSGSGLNTLSNIPYIDFRRIKWEKCSNAGGDDCSLEKGFTFMRVRVAEGVHVDMYNLNTDVGVADEDMSVRAANFAQLTDYMKKWSYGNNVVVFGDTNARYPSSQDGLSTFVEQNSLVDAWYELVRKGDTAADVACKNPSDTSLCENTNKVFSRSSDTAKITASTFEYVGKKFLQHDGNILTDHDPVQVNLTWSQCETLRQSDLFGGPYGEAWFNDAPTIAVMTNRPKATRLAFSGNKRLDRVSITLSEGTTFTHGGNGGDLVTLDLAADEYWTQAQLCQAERDGKTRVFYIKAGTTKNRFREVGKTTPTCTTFTAPSGFQIVGFAGQNGDEIDQLSVIYGLI
ncbi:hypothetical protein BROUX41_001652 [Berkeleyomyces rouxiae]|uniref:uncharacterized protein n=1 Tax=Berkeleyomyces rouxiae TaxID=2035830 RepID=UPI003B7E028C